MKIMTIDDLFKAVQVSVEFDGMLSVENIKAIISRKDTSFIDDFVGAVVDLVRNQWLLDMVVDAIASADGDVIAKYLVSVDDKDVWSDTWGRNYVSCVFNGKGLIIELLGEKMYDRLLSRDDCPYV